MAGIFSFFVCGDVQVIWKSAFFIYVKPKGQQPVIHVTIKTPVCTL